MTYCEELSYRVGDVFEVQTDSCFKKGDQIKLVDDDGSRCPLSELVMGAGPSFSLSQYIIPTAYEGLKYVRKLGNNPVTSDKLKELAQLSGFQIEFHPDGMVHVWDTEMEATTAGTLEEIVELAEAKIEYVKVWAKFTWD